MSIKQRIFKRKFMTGFACHKNTQARMFVLTESDEAIVKGYDFDLKFKKLVAMIRKKYGKFEYCCVKHLQGDKKRLNYHVIYFGSYINQQVIEDWWNNNYDSHRSKMELIKFPIMQAKYLAGYMDKAEKFIGAHFSSWWVFPGWWEFGKWFKHEFLVYPEEKMLVEYANLNKTQLEKERWYALYQDEMVKRGKLKKKPENEKRPLWERVLKPYEYEILSRE
jgi:hypothetical protein